MIEGTITCTTPTCVESRLQQSGYSTKPLSVFAMFLEWITEFLTPLDSVLCLKPNEHQHRDFVGVLFLFLGLATHDGAKTCFLKPHMRKASAGGLLSGHYGLQPHCKHWASPLAQVRMQLRGETL